MNTKNGFVLLHRKIFNSTDFKNQQDISVFIYLLAMASHEPTMVTYRGKQIFLNRGEVCIAERDLAKRFNITKSQVKSIIRRLKSNHNLTHRLTKRLSIYAIVKYDKYQSLERQNDHKTTKKSTTEQSSKLNKLILTSKHNNIIKYKKISIREHLPKLKNVKDIIDTSDE